MSDVLMIKSLEMTDESKRALADKLNAELGPEMHLYASGECMRLTGRGRGDVYLTIRGILDADDPVDHVLGVWTNPAMMGYQR